VSIRIFGYVLLLQHGPGKAQVRGTQSHPANRGSKSVAGAGVQKGLDSGFRRNDRHWTDPEHDPKLQSWASRSKNWYNYISSEM